MRPPRKTEKRRPVPFACRFGRTWNSVRYHACPFKSSPVRSRRCAALRDSPSLFGRLPRLARAVEPGIVLSWTVHGTPRRAMRLYTSFGCYRIEQRLRCGDAVHGADTQCRAACHRAANVRTGIATASCALTVAMLPAPHRPEIELPGKERALQENAHMGVSDEGTG